MLTSTEILAKNISLEEEIKNKLFKESFLRFLLNHLHEFLTYKTKILNIDDDSFDMLTHLKSDHINEQMIEEYNYYYNEYTDTYETDELGSVILIKEIDKKVLPQKNDVISYFFLYWLYNYYGQPFEEELDYRRCSYGEMGDLVDVEKTNTEEHRKIMIDGKNPIINYLFAKDFYSYLNLNRNEIAKHGSVVLDSKDPELNYLFAKYFDFGSIYDSEKCLTIQEMMKYSEVVLNSKDDVLNYLFIDILKNHYNNLISINDDRREDFYESIAKNIFNRIIQHGNVIIDSKNPRTNYLYAALICNYDKKISKECRNTIVNSSDAQVNCLYPLFFKDLSKEEIMEHRQVVLNSKIPEYNYLFADNLIKKLSKEEIMEHRLVVLDSKDPEFNYLFARDLKNFLSENEIMEHANIVFESGISKLIIDFKKAMKETLSEKNFNELRIKALSVSMIDYRMDDVNSNNDKEKLFPFLFSENDNEEIKYFVDLAIEQKNYYLCYFLAKKIGSNLSENMYGSFKRLGQCLLESNNTEYIQHYIDLILNRRIIFRDNEMSFDLSFQKINTKLN